MEVGTIIGAVINVCGLGLLTFFQIQNSKNLVKLTDKLSQDGKDKERLIAKEELKLDLYKSIYPEKVKAAADLIRVCETTVVTFIEWAKTPRSSQGDDQIQRDAAALFREALASEWLLGVAVRDIITRMTLSLNKMILLPENERSYKMLAWSSDLGQPGEDTYRVLMSELSALINQQLHVGLLEKAQLDLANQVETLTTLDPKK